jgi:hypothetical protein
MNREAIIHKIQQECKNIGKKCAPHLYDAGIYCLNDLKKIGTEEAYFRIWQKNPTSVQLNAIYLYALEGAILEIDCWSIPEERKKVLKKYIAELRKSF